MLIEPGDFVKAEFKDETTGESEWMWVKVDWADDNKHLILGRLDSEPVVNRNLKLGTELAVAYDNVHEHIKGSAFNQ